METTPLWNFMRGLCHDFHWDYAIFWKLQPGKMLLKWEEGYSHHTTAQGLMEPEPVDMGFSIEHRLFVSTWGSGRQDECSYDFPVGISLDCMASIQYRMGEGIIGNVALTGNHSWILSEDLLTCEFESNFVPECPDEWLLQFATGIKTIVLIPVAQHGIVQLGSSKKVGEDPILVDLVKDKFNDYLNNLDVVPTLSVELQTKASRLPISKHNMGRFSPSMVGIMKPEDPTAVSIVKQTAKYTSTTNRMIPGYPVENTFYTSAENRVDYGYMKGNDDGYQYTGLDGTIPLYHDIVPEMFDITNETSIAEEMKSLSYINCNFDIYDGDSKVEAELVVPYEDENTNGMTNINSLFSFPMDCELHKALGCTFHMSGNLHPKNLALSSKYLRSSSSDLIDKKSIKGNEPLLLETRECLLNREDEEHLLEAVHASIDSCLTNDLFKTADDAKLLIESSGRLPPSTNECIFVKKGGVPSSSVTFNGPVVTQSPSSFPSENILSTLTNEKKMKKGYKYPQAKKGSKVCIKRSEPGESPKPRPRDRQLIQDRVKELRELVPSGSRCSYDGLLDRTISHILFLRGISERAEKLRHWVNQEISGRKKMRLSGPKSDSKTGTSWAVELGTDFQVCPIVVKDLEYPGHMLIEVITKESLLAAQGEDLHRVMDLLSIRENHAKTLLIHHRWDVDKLFAVFVEKGKTSLFSEVGVAVVERHDLDSSPCGLMCAICMENVPWEELTKMDCGHCFCSDCWTEHFIVKINEGQSKRITCMAHKCNAICDETIVRNLVGKKRR